jgi:hypothetical protein
VSHLAWGRLGANERRRREEKARRGEVVDQTREIVHNHDMKTVNTYAETKACSS